MARGAVPVEELQSLYVEDKYDEFHMACEEGSAVGCHSLGQWFAVVAEKPVEAYSAFRKNCLERRHGNSCLSAGLMHFKAHKEPDAAPEEVEAGLVKSYRKALDFFVRACECSPPHEQGCATAATMLRIGRGTPKKDPKRAFDFDAIACERGHPPSCHQVAAAYITGAVPGVAKDQEKAFKFSKKACDRNFGAACYNLAFMYKNGDGVAMDEKKAEFFWQKMQRLKHEKEMFARQDI